MYRVMIVEDDPMVASIDKQYVEMDRAFRVVRVCKDGREGLEYLERNVVDLVILDYYTPAMTGMEFVDQSSIDQLFRGGKQLPPSGPQPLAKGLNQGTLDHVRAFFAAHPGEFFTSEQVAEQVGLSRITVRRYVSHMADAGEIASSIDYQTGGRPAIRYSHKQGRPGL